MPHNSGLSLETSTLTEDMFCKHKNLQTSWNRIQIIPTKSKGDRAPQDSKKQARFFKTFFIVKYDTNKHTT